MNTGNTASVYKTELTTILYAVDGPYDHYVPIRGYHFFQLLIS